MSKNQSSETNTQESIDKINKALEEEYKNLSYWEAGLAAVGIETGNKKYDNLNKEYLELTNSNLGIVGEIAQIVGDGVSAVLFTWEAAQVLPDLATELQNLRAARNKPDNIEPICQMIADAGPLAEKISSIFHSKTISDSSKENILESTIIPTITPILNKRLGKITKNFQTSETEDINVLSGIDSKFIRELSTLGVDIVSKALASDSNPKVQEIYKNIKQKNESSQAAILQNIHDIITSDTVSPILKNDLVNFLKNPDNQKELVKFTENILNNKEKKFASSELIANTVALVANSSEKLVEAAPFAIEAFNQFKENQRWSNTNLMMEGLTIEDKKTLLEAKKPQTVELVNNAKKIVDTLSPVLEKELPQYLDTNEQNILDVLKNPIVTDKIKSSGKDPEFIKKVVDASMPFLSDALPSITKLASHALSDTDRVADIMQKTQLIKSLPKEEKKKEIKELITTLIEIKNNNPEISKILEKDIPEILTKHAASLGPVVGEFLNTTPIGQKLKLEGKKLVEIAGNHAPELFKIADKFNKREYGKMIVPALKLLADPKVLGLVTESLFKLGKSKVSKDKEPLGTHTSKVLQERQQTKQTGRGI